MQEQLNRVTRKMRPDNLRSLKKMVRFFNANLTVRSIHCSIFQFDKQGRLRIENFPVSSLELALCILSFKIFRRCGNVS